MLGVVGEPGREVEDLDTEGFDAELRAATYLKDWVDMGMLAGCQTD